MWPFSSFVQNCVDFCTRLYPASNEISTYKLQNRVCVRVVLTHVRVPIYVLNLILSNICIIQMSINFLCNQTMQLFCIPIKLQISSQLYGLWNIEQRRDGIENICKIQAFGSHFQALQSRCWNKNVALTLFFFS